MLCAKKLQFYSKSGAKKLRFFNLYGKILSRNGKNMKRTFEDTLNSWKISGMSKPLMVIGARQIGKTYLLKEFCKNNFDNYLYFNLEQDTEITSLFNNTFKPEEIIRGIEIRLERVIDIEHTVFFFDEVQVSENFITSLKYFCESDKPYKIICAGSLLGVKLNRFNSSFPVGKVVLEYMYPMSFKEFLMAIGQNMLIEEIIYHYQNMSAMPDDLHEKALLLYRHYLIVGGMPEAIKDYLDCNGDIVKFNRDIVKSIVEMYISDMNKYTINKAESVKIEKVYLSIPRELAKKNKKFQYKLIEENASKRKFETALDWLNASSIILSCYNTEKVEIPLKVYLNRDVFKVYYSDVGILNSICDVGVNDIVNDTNFMFKGAIAENYVAEEFNTIDIPLIYWKSKGDAEIGFLLTTRDGIIPVEVKATNRIQSKSLNVYMDKYKPKYGIRLSGKNFGFENGIKSIPLYAIFCLNDLKG